MSYPFLEILGLAAYSQWKKTHQEGFEVIASNYSSSFLLSTIQGFPFGGEKGNQGVNGKVKKKIKI